jgi:uncharacterized cupin superfamily protein
MMKLTRLCEVSRDKKDPLTAVPVTVIEPGAWSRQRHWHSHEDELVWVLEGELTLITEGGEEVLRSGDCAAFRHGTTGTAMAPRTR